MNFAMLLAGYLMESQKDMDHLGRAGPIKLCKNIPNFQLSKDVIVMTYKPSLLTNV